MGPDPEIIIGAIGLGSLWVAYNFLYRPAIVTLFRQQLFSLRDRLFMEAVSGRISFDDPQYGMLRLAIQRTIRTATFINIINIILLKLFSSWITSDRCSLEEKLATSLGSLASPERKAVYLRYRAELINTCAIHFVRLYWPPIIGVLVVWALLRIPIKALHSVVRQVQSWNAGSARRYVDAAFALEDDEARLVGAM